MATRTPAYSKLINSIPNSSVEAGNLEISSTAEMQQLS